MNLEKIHHGDMPGDKINIEENHITRAKNLFPGLLEFINKRKADKTVISVFGGSGVGKSEIGSLLAHFLDKKGIQAYVLSGDNYPYRIPEENDEERLNRFRYAGLVAFAQCPQFTNTGEELIRSTWESLRDSDPGMAAENDIFKLYQKAGRAALEEYLGSEWEIDFPLLNSIIRRFKAGEASIPLKRMGRTPHDIRFESIDFSRTEVLMIEWTHGNNPFLEGVEFPIYLFSTPEETLAHRLKRGRDKGVDSPFTKLVLEVEQAKLNSRSTFAAQIISKNGSLITPGELRRRLQ